MVTRNIDDGRLTDKKLGYPYYPLSTALKMAQAVKELGGSKSRVTKTVLAKQLDEEEGSASFSQQITSAKIFGVIEGFGQYGLTDATRMYFFPSTESDQRRALIQIFQTPTAYQVLIARFDGQKLPSKEMLANILHNELGVTVSWKDRTAAMFLSTAKHVGVIDDHGILRVRADAEAHVLRASPENTSPSPIEYRVATPSSPSAAPPTSTNAKIVTWNYKSISLQIPEDIDPALWEKLHGYVQLLKPTP